MFQLIHIVIRLTMNKALSDFFRSITSLPSDITLLSLPAAPIFEIICLACQRQLTAVWLSLANMLVIQLDPPTLFAASTLKSTPSPEALGVISTLLPILLESSLGVLGQPGAMEAVGVPCAFFRTRALIVSCCRILTSCRPFSGAWIP
jgi:hypothetical protein